MFLKTLVVGLLFCGLALAAAGEDSYEGYKVYDIYAKSDADRELLLQFSENENYDFFDLPRIAGKPARLMLPPAYQADFESIMTDLGIEYTIIDENVAASIAAEKAENEQLLGRAGSRINFNSYQRFDAINNYLDELARNYPQRVTVKTIGKSYENRDMKAITITNGDGVANKKVILMDAGIHAREWIAHAGALFVIQQLVENYASNAYLLKNYDWVILPVVNPDGYEYTHTKSRMWRKTRKPVSTLCDGTDGNRNFDFQWGLVGASSNACSDTYRGQTAFSEPETKVLRDLMHSLSGRAQMYLTLHSYGNYLLYPWGYTSALPSTWKDIDEVARAGADAIKAATGSQYTVGSSTNVLYAAAGGSDDYALAKAGIPISITMELPDGGNGFNPAASKIQALVSETWIGIKAMAEKVISKY